jgi:two-component system response regulator QseB
MNVTSIYSKTRRPSEIIALQREIIDQQEAIIEVLKAALAAESATPLVVDPEWMGELTPQERALLAALHRHYPNAVDKYDLLDAMPGRDHVEDRQAQMVNVKVCMVRKKLGADAIESVRGVGYRLGRELHARMSGDGRALARRLAA